MPSDSGTHTHGVGAMRSLAASGVFIAMLVAALALWTLIPLGWIYIGSKVSDTQFPSGGPYAVVGVGIIVSIMIDAWVIGRLNDLYVRITGTNRLAPMRPNWLRSMRDTRQPQLASNTTVVEAVLMGSVMVAAAVFVLWFFFLAGSPLPDQ